MKRIKLLKNICIILALIIAVQIVAISAFALEEFVSEDPDHIPQEEIYQHATAPVETTQPIETQMPVVPIPVESEAVPMVQQETVPVPRIMEETVPVETEPVDQTIDTIPLYFQTDYPDAFYGCGTVASSGCGITSLAMVATYLTDHVFLPDELADYFGGRASNYIERMEYAADAMQLPYEHGLNFHQTIQKLKEGKVAIALMNGDSIFTDTQHFVVLAGYNEDGKIIVLDPYEPNYSHWQLKNALVNGFKEGDISGGFAGSWVFDKAAMPEEPFIYQEERVEVECRYPDLDLTIEEIDLLARMVWVEAQGEPFEGQQAVAEVVLNRLAADNFQSTLRGVVDAEGQFRSTSKLEEAKPNQTQYDAIEQAWHGPYVLPEDVVFFATYPVNENVWGTIGGHVFCHQW